MAAPNRLELLAAQSAVTGIDFVFVNPDQTTLDVHFLRSPATLDSPLTNDLEVGAVSIAPVESGDPTVTVSGLAWVGPAGAEDVLRVTVASPGGFSPYKLEISDSRVDPYYRSVRFSFKANCPTDLDCEPAKPECPAEDELDFPVDYQARDFWSFRQALLDFASQRYPEWTERSEADMAVMAAEVMSALGDELAYYQDRVAREAYLDTATERRSLRRHARLVDYTVHDGRGAHGWLDVQVGSGQAEQLPAGTEVWALGADGTKVYFSVGTGMADDTAYDVRTSLNKLPAHIWHEDDLCLAAGSTQLDVEIADASEFVFNDPSTNPTGRWAYLQTSPDDPSIPARTHLVHVTSATALTDPLLGTTLVRLTWAEEHATTHQMELGTLRVHANLVPITAGRTLTEMFTIGNSEDTGTAPSAVERQGRGVEDDTDDECAAEGEDCPQTTDNRVIAYLFTVPETDTDGLVWLGDDLEDLSPEIQLYEVEQSSGAWVRSQEWDFRRSFLGAVSSQAEDFHFTLDDGRWERVVGYQTSTGEVEHVDYVGDGGVSIRFGDGEFGRVPAEGTVFEVTYRVGNGSAGNLPALAVANFDSEDASLSFISSVSNPFPTEGGVSPQTPDEVRFQVPQAFRALTYRAVRPEDYAEAAERLDWVQRAGAAFRWTGSWLTAFVTPDPSGATEVTDDHVVDLERQLDRFRQAGREAYFKQPKYVDLDLEITLCASTSAFRDEVQESVLEALFGDDGDGGFFSPDRFTFGTPLERSALEAEIQGVSGVTAVRRIRIRRRALFDWRNWAELTLEVGDDEVIRVENDPDRPDHGLVSLIVEGGA